MDASIWILALPQESDPKEGSYVPRNPMLLSMVPESLSVPNIVHRKN